MRIEINGETLLLDVDKAKAAGALSRLIMPGDVYASPNKTSFGIIVQMHNGTFNLVGLMGKPFRAYSLHHEGGIGVSQEKLLAQTPGWTFVGNASELVLKALKDFGVK